MEGQYPVINNQASIPNWTRTNCLRKCIQMGLDGVPFDIQLEVGVMVKVFDNNIKSKW